jgi:hypothetical protein
MIKSADEAASWAHRNLTAKNTLTATDAKMVEDQFRLRLSAIGAPDGIGDGSDASGTPDNPARHEPPHAVGDPSMVSSGTNTRQKAPTRPKRSRSGDAVHSLGKTVRLRDKDHRTLVMRQPCLVCGRIPSDAHHLTFTQPRALGKRVSDEFTVPVCRVHHRELHRCGDEAAWWRRVKIDPLPVALRLWQHTRADGELEIREPQPMETSDMSAQGRQVPNVNPHVNAATTSSKDADTTS